MKHEVLTEKLIGNLCTLCNGLGIKSKTQRAAASAPLKKYP